MKFWIENKKHYIKYLESIKTLGLLMNHNSYRDRENLLLMKECINKFGLESKMNKLNFIHICGTKGKGTVGVITERLLREHGLKTGLYTSPHLTEIRERIKINGTSLSYKEFNRYFESSIGENLKYLKEMNIGYFQALTLMAFDVFENMDVDVAIIETGIGGRYDCTNIIPRVLSIVMTLIEMDHSKILGNSLKEIALNKAGVIKPHSTVFTRDQNIEVMKVIEEEVAKQNAELKLVKLNNSDIELFKSLKLPLHQYTNVKLSLFTLNHVLNNEPIINVKDFNIIKNIEIDGRCQIINTNNIIYMLDGCHTLMSAKACAKWVLSTKKNIDILIFNCIGDRDHESILKELMCLEFKYIIFNTNLISKNNDNIECMLSNDEFKNQLCRIYKFVEMVKQLKKESIIKSFETIEESLSFINDIAKDKMITVLVAGSLHLVGNNLKVIEKEIIKSY